MPNRTEATMRKLSSAATGRLKPLRLFSTLLSITLIDVRRKHFSELLPSAVLLVTGVGID
jgi:hypothetical protein